MLAQYETCAAGYCSHYEAIKRPAQSQKKRKTEVRRESVTKKRGREKWSVSGLHVTFLHVADAVSALEAARQAKEGIQCAKLGMRIEVVTGFGASRQPKGLVSEAKADICSERKSVVEHQQAIVEPTVRRARRRRQAQYRAYP